MLISTKQIVGSTIEGSEGSVGTIKDIYFDGDDWVVRYLVVDTGKWLPGKKVLLTPRDIHDAEWDAQRCFVRQTKEQVKNAPTVDVEQPVSRQLESDLAAYYGWPTYWDGGTVLGAPAPVMVTRPQVTIETVDLAKKLHDGNPNLRSFAEVESYAIAAKDGNIGNVQHLIATDDGWSIQYLVVSTGNWLSGRSVLIARDWIDEVRWIDASVTVDLTRRSVEASPEFDDDTIPQRQYEEHLHSHYGKQLNP